MGFLIEHTILSSLERGKLIMALAGLILSIVGLALSFFGGWLSIIALPVSIVGLILAIIGAIFMLVTKNPMGWSLFKAALVLVIITFVFTFIYGLFCSGSASWKMVKAFGAKGSLGPSFGAWFSFGVSVLSLLGLKKIKEL